MPLELYFERISHPHIVGYRVRIIARGFGLQEGTAVTISDDYVTMTELDGEINRLMNQLYEMREEAKAKFAALPVVQDPEIGIKAFRDYRYGNKAPPASKDGPP